MTTKPTHARAGNGAFGRDLLFGSTENDLLTGAAGSDIFVISEGYGSDTINNFETGSDALRVHNDGFATFANFRAAAGISGTSAALESAENIFHQGPGGEGIIDTPATVLEATSNIGLALSQMTQAATIGAGATLELPGADLGSITFAGSTGTLILDHSSLFTGKIFNLTGDGNPFNSDQIDLRDVAFGSGTAVSYAGNSSGGILTVSDAQNHAAHLSLAGNYTNSTFNLSSDGHGGTTVIDPPVTPFALGVDVGNPNISNPTEEAAFEFNFNGFSTLMGATPQYLDQFGNQADPISQWVGQASWDAASVAASPVLHNVTPVIGLPMSSTAPGSGTADQFYQAFAAGTYDSVLQGMVKTWANYGFTTQIWRPGWEMNISSMPSYAGSDAGTQADWIKAYQHIYTVLHAAGQADGVNVQVMWNPGVVNYSNAGNVIQTAYPGNQYVDMIGADVYADVYPYGDHTHLYDWDLSGQMLNSPNPVYDTSLQQWAADPVNLQHYYAYPASNQWSLDGSVGHATTLQELIDLAKSTGKPFAIPETGAGNTADGAGLVDNPTFVQWLSQTLRQSGVSVSFVNIWDSNGGGYYQFSNTSDGKPLEAAAWAEYFGAASVPTPSVTSFSPDSAAVGDGITNANQLTLTGTAIAGSTVEVSDGATQIGTVTTNASGSWSFVTATLADGNHSFTAEDMDAAGNVSAASAALNVTIDTVAPGAPSITSFSPDSNIVGDGITNANQLSLTGTAEAGSKVLIFDGSTQVGTAATDVSGNWSFATGARVDGTHVFTSEAVDAAGNVSTISAALNITVDTVVPNAPTIASDTPASSNAMIVSGTAEAGSTVKLYDGTTLLGTAVTASNDAWSITTGSLAPGFHQFAATATDAAGNVSNLSNVLDPVIGAVIESSGSTSLIEFGNNFFLDSNSSGSGPELKYAGAVVVAGQFGSGWTPIGAEATATGYDVAWKNMSTGQYTVWSTDSNGNYTASITGAVSGNSSALESLETTFHQDLNGDGTIGLVATVIESFGSTSLVEVGTTYDLDSIGSGTGPELKDGGAAVTAGEFGSTVPIGAEQTATGYDVAWKIPATGQYTVWSTDSNGNYTASITGVVSGNSSALESLETTFHQDLNGDGTIGLVATVIESFGSTSLVEVGTTYDLDSIGSGTGPELKDGGAAVTAGEFGSTVPIGAEQTATGYDVAWKIPATGQYTVWSTDSNGNYTASITGAVSGNSSALESLETTFHQDLNGDGTIGLVATVIESFGSTSLVEVGTTYDLDSIGSGTGPELKDGGAAVTAGEFGSTVPIGAEQTATGYDVAWKIPATGQYTVWSTDSNGNYTASITGVVSGNSSALESLETTFHQDLNGDGTIGLVATVIESFGSTSLVEVGTTYDLDSIGSGTGPELKDGGAAVTAGEFGSTVPIGAEQTATGYDVAWKIPATGQYTVWSTDSNGNYTASITGVVSGNSSALESLEPTFHQDLNGDGVINTASTILEISGNVSLTLSNMTQAVKIDAGATLELTGAVSGSITFNASTGNLVLDHASQFAGTLINLSGDGTASNSNQIDLKDIAYAAGTSESYSGNATGGVLTVVDSQNHAAHISLVGDYTHSTFNLSNDGNGGTLVIDPPKDGFDFAPVPAHGAVPASVPVVAARLGSDGFVFDRAESFGSAAGAGVEAINAHRGQLTLLEDTIRSAFDHQPEPFHVAAPVDTHFADFHNFMLHA